MKPHRSIRTLPSLFRAPLAESCALLLFLLPACPALAGSATWLAAPTSGDWNTAGNWTPSAVPNGLTDAATFGVSTTPTVSLSNLTLVDTILFTPGASVFTITTSSSLSLAMIGAGIANNSGIVQNLVAGVDGTGNHGMIQFRNGASAGSMIAINNSGATLGGAFGGSTQFFDSSSAGSGTFTLNGGTVSGASGGGMEFFNSASAANGTFINNGGPVGGAGGGFMRFGGSSNGGTSVVVTHGGAGSGATGGITIFVSTSNAGSATFTTNGGTASGAGGGETTFDESSSAGSGTFTTNGGSASGALGGQTRFLQTSTAANARFVINGGAAGGARQGFLSFENHATAGNGAIRNAGGTLFGADGGATRFWDGTTAGSAKFTNDGGTISGALGGTTTFNNDSTAANGTFTNNGGTQTNAGGGITRFLGTSGAGVGTFINNANTESPEFGGATQFSENASAESGTFHNKGGFTTFDGDSNAGTGTFDNEGGSGRRAFGGSTIFNGSASAGTGTFTNKSGDAIRQGGGSTRFLGNATAGSGRFINLGGAAFSAEGGYIEFSGNSTAGNGTFVTNGSAARFSIGGSTRFFDSSTAGTGTFTTNGGASSQANGGVTEFLDHSSAGRGIFTANGGTASSTMGGSTQFFDNSTAENAKFVNNGGTVDGTSGGSTSFQGNAKAGSGDFVMNGGAAIGAFGGVAEFSGNATAENGTFSNHGGAVSGALGGITRFFDDSNAGNGTFKNNGVSIAAGSGSTAFTGTSSAGRGVFINHGGGLGGSTQFFERSTAGAGTFINSGGTTRFSGESSAGRGTFTNLAGGSTQFFDSSSAGNGTFITRGDTGLSGIGALTHFTSNSTAGSGTFINTGSAENGGSSVTLFDALSSASHGTFTNKAGAVNGASGGFTQFDSGSNAGHAVIMNEGSTVNGAEGGSTEMAGTAGGGSATFINRGGTTSDAAGGITYFSASASAGNATLIANGGAGGGDGGAIFFRETSEGGSARVKVFGNGKLDISQHFSPGMEIGSIEGDGNVFLGSQSLTVGGNDGSTTFSGVMQDSGVKVGKEGSLTKIGAGTLTLSGINTYTGGTHVNGGKLAIFSDENIGPGLLSLDGGVLQTPAGFASNRAVALGAGGGVFDTEGTDATLSGAISGPGGFTKLGAGALTLSGGSSFTGDTSVAQGALVVDGSLASANVTVHAGTMIGGTGTLFGNVIASGVVSPGHSPGTLSIGGNYTQKGGGTLVIEVASVTLFDKLTVGTKASLDGGLKVIRLDGFRPQAGDRLEFLSAKGGVSGVFQTVSNDFDALGNLVTLKVVYEASNVTLVGMQNSFSNALGLGTAGNPFGLTRNQVAVSGALDSALFDSRQRTLLRLLDNTKFATLPHQMDLIAPEELASMYETGFSLATVQSTNLQRRMDDIRSGSNGFSAAGLAMSGGKESYSGGLGVAAKGVKTILEPEPDNRWGVFVSGTGEFVNVDGTENASGYDLSTGGLTLGLDYRVCSGFAVGVNAGYASTSADLVNDGRMTLDGGKLGLYATVFSKTGFYLDAAIGGGLTSYETRRRGLEGRARGDADGTEFNALLGTGYDLKKGALTIGPTATFQYTCLDIDGFRERGSLAPLAIDGKGTESVRSTLGFKASYELKIGRVLVKPELRAAWQHEYGDREYAIEARFANGAGDQFTVDGPRTGRDSLLLGAGVAAQFGERTSAYLFYDGQLGRTNYDSHSISGGVRFAF